MNGRLANEGFRRCHRFVEGWLKHADPKSGLIPRNLDRDRGIWNAKDSAADNYPFMVLTAAITDRPLFDGRMLDMLRSETSLTSRIGHMPDTYDFAKRGFHSETPDYDSIIFGSSEYIKDGLLPLTEWLGPSPWRTRMIGILDDMWKTPSVETACGRIVSNNVEVNGEMLQTLSRVYWMTGDRKYLEWAIRLGDYYLLGDHHPTGDFATLRLRDHGCEIVSGLCELYATVSFAMPEKKQQYETPVHEMMDRILEVGRNGHGLFYNAINPQSGTVRDKGVADTWGYTLNGHYTVYLIDRTEPYRRAVLDALGCLNEHYRTFAWERAGSDGYADSIESALNLYNRERVHSAAEWIDSETKVMWGKQQADGVIEGWHGDGNFARTTIMYCLWKTKGVTVRPWRDDLVFGSVQDGDKLEIGIRAEKDWKGKLVFDIPRYKTNMNMPIDWPRINQFPEWFTVDSGKQYVVENLTAGYERRCTGEQLHDGIALELEAGVELHLRLRHGAA